MLPAPLLLAAAAAGAGRTVTLSNGVEMPLVELGLGGYMTDQPQRAQKSIIAAFGLGFTGIDTAHMYNQNKGIAAAVANLSARRESFFLTSKVPGNMKAPYYENTIQTVEGDLAELGMSYVDLMLIHYPSSNDCAKAADCTKMQAMWQALEDLYAGGKLKAIGVSNFCQDCLKCIAQNSTVTPMVNQVPWHIGMGKDAQHGLRDYCAKQGTIVEAYSPLSNGAALKSPAAVSIGAAHNKSAAQVALRWVLQRGLPLAIGGSNPQYLAEDIDVFDWSLTDAEMATLDGLDGPTCASEPVPFRAPSGCCS